MSRKHASLGDNSFCISVLHTIKRIRSLPAESLRNTLQYTKQGSHMNGVGGKRKDVLPCPPYSLTLAVKQASIEGTG